MKTKAEIIEILEKIQLKMSRRISGLEKWSSLKEREKELEDHADAIMEQQPKIRCHRCDGDGVIEGREFLLKCKVCDGTGKQSSQPPGFEHLPNDVQESGVASDHTVCEPEPISNDRIYVITKQYGSKVPFGVRRHYAEIDFRAGFQSAINELTTNK